MCAGHKSLRASLLALALLSPLAAQDEIIVDAAGGGDYTALQPAIDAAAPWQVIRVRHGVYEGAVIRKSVRLLGDPFQPFSVSSFPVIEITSPILVEDIPAGASVVITDVAADPIGKLWDFDDLIVAKNCQGPIHLAFTAAGNIVVEDCSYVTITDHHGRGRFRALRSTVVTSRCLVVEWNGPTIDLDCSTFISTRLITGPKNPGDQAVRLDGGSVFIADSRSPVLGGGLGVEPYQIIDGVVDDQRLEYLVFNGDQGFGLRQSPDFLLLELHETVGTIQAEALAGSLPAFPSTSPNGEFFLDPPSFQLLHVQAGFTGSEVRVHLPSILRPSRYFDVNPPFNRLALPNARLQGIPVVFQGAFLIDGVAKYTLPYILVL